MSYDPRGGGPESTTYDKARHERMNLRTMPYGFFRVATESIQPKRCASCHREITGQLVNINGVFFHYGCYGR